MSEKLTVARIRLQALDRAVAAGDVGEDRHLWGGAGLCVVTAMPASPYEESYRYVVTQYAANLSWLVRALWITCRPLFGSMTKFEFFGRLGNAAHRYQRSAGDSENARDLLGAVIHEAYGVLSDIEDGRFHALPVAPDGIVHDDLLPDAEHDDALSVTEIEQWFKGHDVQANRPDPALPFLAYGIFAPGQIAFPQLKKFVRHITDTSIVGILLIRDGVPVLDTSAQGRPIVGHRIEFQDADAPLAYDVIQRMEPPTQYRWSVSGGMNILIGLKPQRGSHPMETDAWGWSDPAFHDALRVVDEALTERIDWDDLRPFYRLQGAYMVLWSSIERYLSLRYHLGRNDKVVEQINRLAGERQFEASLRDTNPAATQKLRKLFRSDDPGKTVRFDPSGSPKKAIEYLYQVRSNVTHRGKAQRVDWTLLHTATEEALRIFRDVLRAAEESAQWPDPLAE